MEFLRMKVENENEKRLQLPQEGSEISKRNLRRQIEKKYEENVLPAAVNLISTSESKSNCILYKHNSADCVKTKNMSQEEKRKL